MYDAIFAAEDESYLTDKRPARIEVMRLDDPLFQLSAPDSAPEGRLLFAVPTGSIPLDLEKVHALRDALTEHLSGYPDPMPQPVAA